jgi:FeS assembly SUF system protein
MENITSKISMEQKVINMLKTIFDPEIPVDIYELGLIYEIKINENGHADIEMTLTSPNCPVAESLPIDVENKVKEVHGINTVKVNIVFDPPWDRDMMSEEAKLDLGML